VEFQSARDISRILMWSYHSMDGNWQGIWWNTLFSAKYRNIAREFCQEIEDSALKIYLGIKLILLGNRRIILLKMKKSQRWKF